MTELQQALALEETIEHNGEVYKLGPIGVEVMGAWEDWIAGETLERTLRLLGRTNPNAERLAIESVAKLSAAGEFDFYGEASQARMRQLNGQKKMTYFRIKQHHPTVLPAVVAEIVEGQWERLYRAIQKDMAAQEALNPNAQAPTRTGENQSGESGGEQSSPASVPPSTSSPQTSESAV